MWYFATIIDARELRDLERKLSGFPGAFAKAVVEAVNHTTNKTRTLVVRAMAERYTLQSAKIRQAVTTVRASLRSNSFEGEVITRGRPLSLINYQVTGKSLAARRRGPKPGGLMVRVLRGGPAKQLRHAFITYGKVAKSGSSNIHVFQRVMEGGKPVGRYPIEVLPAPSQPSQTKTILPQVAPQINSTLMNRLRRDVDRLFSTGGKWK